MGGELDIDIVLASFLTQISQNLATYKAFWPVSKEQALFAVLARTLSTLCMRCMNEQYIFLSFL